MGSFTIGERRGNEASLTARALAEKLGATPRVILGDLPIWLSYRQRLSLAAGDGGSGVYSQGLRR